MTYDCLEATKSDLMHLSRDSTGPSACRAKSLYQTLRMRGSGFMLQQWEVDIIFRVDSEMSKYAVMRDR